MRFSLLIFLLTSFVFSALPVDSLRLAGSKAWQTITINHLSVAETNSHFLYQRKIPRIGAVALNVDSANDVGFTGVNDTIRIPRWVLFTPDTIYLYADLAVSSTADTSYCLQFGKALSEVNASATFTNCGITNYVGFNDGTGSSSVLDMASGGSATVTAPATIGGALTFDGCATFTGSTSQRIEFGSELIGTGARTISMIIRPTVASPSLIAIDNGECAFSMVTSGTQRVYYTSNAPTYLSNSAADVTANNTYLLTATRTVTGAAVIYINGLSKASGASGTPVAGTANLRLGISAVNTGPLTGPLDEFYLSNDVKTANYEQTRYNMLFTPSTFSTLGAVQSVATTGSRWNSYKSAFKSAFKPAYK